MYFSIKNNVNKEKNLKALEKIVKKANADIHIQDYSMFSSIEITINEQKPSALVRHDLNNKYYLMIYIRNTDNEVKISINDIDVIYDLD